MSYLKLLLPWIYNYQTLISGFLALAGAITTVFIIHRQIRQASEQEAERRRRRNFSARAMMPAALSELSDYAQKCVRALSPLLTLEPERWSTSRLKAKIPPIPDNALPILHDSIEFAANSVSTNIADLVCKLQIQHPRLLNINEWIEIPDEVVVRDHVSEFIVDALEIYARCSNLFLYARREIEGVAAKLSRDDIISAAHNCEIFVLSPELANALARRCGKQE